MRSDMIVLAREQPQFQGDGAQVPKVMVKHTFLDVEEPPTEQPPVLSRAQTMPARATGLGSPGKKATNQKRACGSPETDSTTCSPAAEPEELFGLERTVTVERWDYCDGFWGSDPAPTTQSTSLPGQGEEGPERVTSEERQEQWETASLRQPFVGDVPSDAIQVLKNLRQSASVARQLDLRSLPAVHKVYCELDTNGDGKLSLQEVRTGFERIFGKGSDLDVEALFEQLDLDSSGELDYTEFLTACIGKRISTEVPRMMYTDMNTSPLLSSGLNTPMLLSPTGSAAYSMPVSMAPLSMAPFSMAPLPSALGVNVNPPPAPPTPCGKRGSPITMTFDPATRIILVVWKFDVRKLNGNDKQAVSPPFDLWEAVLQEPPEVASRYSNKVPKGAHKLVVHPKCSKEAMEEATKADKKRGGKQGGENPSFKQARGNVTVQLKCEADVVVETNFGIKFAIGRGGKRQEQDVPFTHNFAAHAVSGASRLDEWNFNAAVDGGSNFLDLELMLFLDGEDVA